MCPQGETAITVPIDGRHNARGLDSREFSTARQSIWPRRASGRAGWRGWVGEKEEEICRDRKAAIELIRLMSASSIVCMFSECAPAYPPPLACLPACLGRCVLVFKGNELFVEMKGQQTHAQEAPAKRPQIPRSLFWLFPPSPSSSIHFTNPLTTAAATSIDLGKAPRASPSSPAALPCHRSSRATQCEGVCAKFGNGFASLHPSSQSDPTRRPAASQSTAASVSHHGMSQLIRTRICLMVSSFLTKKARGSAARRDRLFLIDVGVSRHRHHQRHDRQRER